MLYASLAQSVEHAAVNRSVVGSSPTGSANGSIAQLGEHLPYKQRVIGSSPIVPTIFNTYRNIGSKKLRYIGAFLMPKTKERLLQYKDKVYVLHSNWVFN